MITLLFSKKKKKAKKQECKFEVLTNTLRLIYNMCTHKNLFLAHYSVYEFGTF